MDSNNQLDILDILAILSFVIGYNNLLENREQSRHNDVTVANDRQANYLLKQINSRFDLLNSKIDKLLKAGEKSE